MKCVPKHNTNHDNVESDQVRIDFTRKPIMHKDERNV